MSAVFRAGSQVSFESTGGRLCLLRGPMASRMAEHSTGNIDARRKHQPTDALGCPWRRLKSRCAVSVIRWRITGKPERTGLLLADNSPTIVSSAGERSRLLPDIARPALTGY
jgi:hypothetical protein